ncbi:MAG TPA: zf-HC2 domain-containing protein [Candidatus Limnocylindria bacterium]|nr:zf-HC2 domain-containing protein [Candidatus Limnocylindria bacterium]
MNHPKREEWIPLLFGEADAETKRRLETHLTSCAECAAEVSGWRRSLGRLDAWKLSKPARTMGASTWRPAAWAAAAAVVIAAFGVGRFTAPAVDAQKLRTELKSELSAEIQQGFTRLSEDSSTALGNLELRLAAASTRDNKELANEFVQVIQAIRTEDREATESLLEKLQRQYTTDFVLLRRDLETLASTTDDEIESARARLFQLASNQNP